MNSPATIKIEQTHRNDEQLSECENKKEQALQQPIYSNIFSYLYLTLYIRNIAILFIYYIE